MNEDQPQPVTTRDILEVPRHSSRIASPTRAMVTAPLGPLARPSFAP